MLKALYFILGVGAVIALVAVLHIFCKNSKSVDDAYDRANEKEEPSPEEPAQAEPAPEERPTWEDYKAKVLAAIKNDEQPEYFEALVTDITNFMAELKRTGELDAISVTLQEDA